MSKPVLVMSDPTERSERIAAGTLKLLETNEEVICNMFKQLLENRNEYEKMSKSSKSSNPYGDAFASKRIADILESN